MKRKIRIAQFGLGPIGRETARLAASRPWAQVVGGVDSDPAKRGEDLGKLTGTSRLHGRRVFGSLDELLQHTKADLVIHTTVSRFAAAYQQLESMARAGLHVVSSCEEMLFPQLAEPRLARKLDELCRQHGSRMVGTGVNPGFVMDVLPLCLSSVVRQAHAVHVQRVVNASTRRETLQRKIGSGLPPRIFRRMLRAREAGHAGLRESLALIAHCLGWRVQRIAESGNAVVARRPIRTAYLRVKAGETCGLHQRATATVGGQIRLTLDLKMYLNARDPHDAIQIDGDPPVRLLIPGGVPGDQATAAVLVNTARRLIACPPGLRLVTDLPLPRHA